MGAAIAVLGAAEVADPGAPDPRIVVVEQVRGVVVAEPAVAVVEDDGALEAEVRGGAGVEAHDALRAISGAETPRGEGEPEAVVLVDVGRAVAMRDVADVGLPDPGGEVRGRAAQDDARLAGQSREHVEGGSLRRLPMPQVQVLLEVVRRVDAAQVRGLAVLGVEGVQADARELHLQFVGGLGRRAEEKGRLAGYEAVLDEAHFEGGFGIGVDGRDLEMRCLVGRGEI